MSIAPRPLPHARALALTCLLSPAAIAQCALQWQHFDPLPYVHGNVAAVAQWDPDGAGPAPAVVLAGGEFDVGHELALHVAAWDGVHWATLGTLPGPVTALTTWNLQPVAAAVVNGAEGVYLWNGTSWQLLGTTGGSTGGHVRAMAEWNGSLYVAGGFSSLGVPANNIARWNGTSWAALGSGTNNSVFALVVYQSLLHVGGQFTSAGGVAVGNLAAWNGTNWLATAPFNGPILCLATCPGIFGSEFLFAGGAFTAVGSTPATYIARFQSALQAWSAIGPGLPGYCVAMTAQSGSSFYGDVTAAIQPTSFQSLMWRWSGLQWNNLGTLADNTVAYPMVTGVTWFGNELITGLTTGYQAVRRFDFTATTWPALLGFGIQGSVFAVDAEGSDVVIGGAFANVSGTMVNCIARGGPGAWQPLGSGVEAGGLVYAVARMFGGDVIAGGIFASAGGVPANNIARWNGATWSPLGSGINGTVYAVRRLGNGDILIGGAFTLAGGVLANNVARWNGSAWTALGSGVNGTVNALVEMPNGDLVLGGQFSNAGGGAASRVARWNGASWSSLGAGFNNTVYALAIADGALCAGGAFTFSGAVSLPRVARWTGALWLAPPISGGFQPTNAIYSLLALPDGDLVAGGAPTLAPSNSPPFTGLTCLMRKDTIGNWSNLGVHGPAVYAAARTPSGSIVAAGEFWATSSAACGNVDRLASTCPAGVAPFGAGCASSLGPVLQNPIDWPWLGGIYRGGATGVPAQGFGVVITGFTQVSIPIASLLPQGLPGCSLLVSPDLLDVLLPIGGQVITQVAIPPTPTLVGQTFYQQVAPFEYDLLGNLTAISSSNGLALTIGVL